MKAELLEQLRKITPEEQEILNGRKQINEAIYVQSEGHVFDSRKLLDASKLIIPVLCIFPSIPIIMWK